MKNVTQEFSSRARKLEDAFFLEQLAIMKKMKETKESLKNVSGIENDAILQKLVDLGIPPHIVASLSIIPLVEVAWADGKVGEKEKAALMKAARLISEIDQELLALWLNHRPQPKLLEAWIHYIRGLCEKLSEKEQIILKDELLSHARAIAGAEGGIMGLGSKISTAESTMLARLEEGFGYSS